MKKILTLSFLSIVLLLSFLSSSFCQEDPSRFILENDGRYVLRIMNGRAVTNNRVPAIVLDQIRGVVWTCQNLQDGRPLWVRADLGQNGAVPLTKKKYTIKMLEWQDADLRMPAIVLDIEEGIVWTCQNIVDGKARWIQTDLTSGKEKTISREKLGIIKSE
jgi:hypothetical protein